MPGRKPLVHQLSVAGKRGFRGTTRLDREIFQRNVIMMMNGLEVGAGNQESYSENEDRITNGSHIRTRLVDRSGLSPQQTAPESGRRSHGPCRIRFQLSDSNLNLVSVHEHNVGTPGRDKGSNVPERCHAIPRVNRAVPAQHSDIWLVSNI